MAELSDLLVTPAAPNAAATTPSQVDDAYAAWAARPGPDSMKGVLDALDTTINSEVQRFSGPKPLLRSRARALAVRAVKTYDPAGGARLRSWVVTQLQPLSRYNNQLKPVYAPEDAARKAYAVSKAKEEFIDETGRDPTDDELADRVGISVKRLRAVRKMAPAVMNEPQASESDDGATPDFALYHSNPMREAGEAVYADLDGRDRAIFDMRTGSHGRKETAGKDIAALLRVSPGYVTQRANAIADRIMATAGRFG